MEDRKVNIDGINIAYTRRGSGVPLVLMHGYPLDRSIWNRLAPLLEDSYDMIIPDLRGFGESEVMEADRSITGYASDLAGILESLQLRKAFVVGHSMGGYVALAFVRQYPERVLGLGLIASQMAEDAAGRKDARRSAARKIMAEGVSAVATDMLPKLSSRASIRETLSDVILKQQPLALACALEAMAGRPDSTDLFSTLEMPVMIVHGDADQLIPIERAREMRAQLPSVHYMELEGVGHMPMMENSAVVADAVRWLQSRTASNIKILDS